MTTKAALMVVFGLIIALVSIVIAVNPPFPTTSQYDSANDIAKLIAGICAIGGMIIFAIGALSKTRKE